MRYSRPTLWAVQANFKFLFCCLVSSASGNHTPPHCLSTFELWFNLPSPPFDSVLHELNRKPFLATDDSPLQDQGM